MESIGILIELHMHMHVLTTEGELSNHHRGRLNRAHCICTNAYQEIHDLFSEKKECSLALSPLLLPLWYQMFSSRKDRGPHVVLPSLLPNPPNIQFDTCIALTIYFSVCRLTPESVFVILWINSQLIVFNVKDALFVRAPRKPFCPRFCQLSEVRLNQTLCVHRSG